MKRIGGAQLMGNAGQRGRQVGRPPGPCGVVRGQARKPPWYFFDEANSNFRPPGPRKTNELKVTILLLGGGPSEMLFEEEGDEVW